jgi:small subunit ribosomal protein S16
MLAIRMQRTGRKGHAQFRVVVQDSRRTPTSGKIVAQLGTYDPHTKTITLNKERAEHYLTNGAQPSPRVTSLLKAEGIALPTWVKDASKKEGKIRSPEKLRRNQPKVEAPVEVSAEPDTPDEEAVSEAEVSAEKTPAEA